VKNDGLQHIITGCRNNEWQSQRALYDCFYCYAVVLPYCALEEEARQMLNLFALEGYSHPEIGEMLGISVGAFKSNLWKARADLKQLMVNYLPKKYG